MSLVLDREPTRTIPAPLIAVEDLSVTYSGRHGVVPAVARVSLALAPGQSLGVVGESGCGKSTLALAIMAYLAENAEITSGRVRFKGSDMASMSPEELRQVRGGGMAMVFQEPGAALNPSMRIVDQLVEAAVYHREIDEGTARREAGEMLRDVGLPDVERILGSYPHQLSGGQQQRAVIAMALLGHPSLLLLDEPTTNLDVTVEASVVELIGHLRRRHGTGLIYISHNLGLIAQVCDRVAVMYAGEIVEEGPIDAVFAAPKHPYTAGLLRCIPQPHTDKTERKLRPIRGQVDQLLTRLPGCGFAARCDHAVAGRCDQGELPLVDVDAGARHLSRCIRWMEIADATETPDDQADAGGVRDEVLLTVRDLDKFYPVEESGLASLFGGRPRRVVKANQRLSFRVRRGQTLAIVGESGCGKSTFAKVLMGLEQATAGSIELAGLDLATLAVDKRDSVLLRSLQIVFQNPDETLNPCYSIGTQIGRVIRKFGIARARGQVQQEIKRLLALTRLPATLAARRPHQLSGGQKQRVAIARAFAGRPSTVVADEPVSSLDVSVRAAIIELLVDLQTSEGTTLLMISHDLGLVRYMADRVVVMYLGQIMESGTTAEVFAPPYHPYTEALLSAVPVADPALRRRRIVLEGEIPSAMAPPSGCPFHTRCHRKLGAACETQKPPEQRMADGSHRITCHIPAAELAQMGDIFGKPGGRRDDT
ncbi:MAG: ABC transporter ATP-binding protein [Alphaproteobacteria bacterium]|nr:ABC transporter ATP-binding protein [Alphaproteobacteria bacterium]